VEGGGTPLNSKRILQAQLIGPPDSMGQLLVGPQFVDVGAVVDKYPRVDHKAIVELEGNNLNLNKLELYLRLEWFLGLFILALLPPTPDSPPPDIDLLVCQYFIQLYCTIGVEEVHDGVVDEYLGAPRETFLL
jgi:hypothetical protein